MPRTILLLMLTLTGLLAGCTALPRPSPGEGLIVLPYFFQNSSPISEPIRRFELNFSDGSAETIVPADDVLIFARRNPVSLVSIRGVIDLENWTGDDWVNQARMDFTVVPGSIVISDHALVFTQAEGHPNNRIYDMSWRFNRLTVSQRSTIEARLKADGNYHYWSLY